MKEYDFPWPDGYKNYNLFPDELENDPCILFHGTSEGNFSSICENGFKFSERLQSVSYAYNSGLPLRYASESRNEASPNSVVIAVKFENLDIPYIAKEGFGIHVYHSDIQPNIVGYCIIPSNYDFR